MYPDGIGRNQAAADYGTNADAPLVRAETIPASSDTVHVSLTLYNDRGESYQSVDANGTIEQTTFDNVGRRIELIRNYQAGQPSTGSVNVTVQWAYTADNLEATMKALNAATGDQLTASEYGTTLGTSDVARNDVLSSTVYADGSTVRYFVNRQSERKQLTDQNGTVHSYGFDLLANPIADSVTTLGTGVDGSVRRIARTYDVRGLLEHVTSFSDAVGTTVVNDVLRVYNTFEQCINEYQEHNGVVNTATSVVVGHQYADGSENTLRQTGLVYPNGRTITLDYGISGGIDDALSRVESLIDDDDTILVSYTHIGAATFVKQVSPQPQIAWSLINGADVDPYTGLNQFNQIADNRWYNTAAAADLDRIQHSYDRAGNRLCRKNTVAETAGVHLDELYAVNGLYRLARLDRGQLNNTNDGIISGTEDFTQAWVFDATENWTTFSQADTGGSWTLEQTRTSNKANEITGITGGGWVVPTYDAAGNTVGFPQPNAPSTAGNATYDAWNRMMAVSSGGSAVQANVYDGENRRVETRVSGSTRHDYFSFDWQPIEERLGSSSSPERQFVWGQRYIDDLLLRDRGGERFYALQDPNWNVTGICGPTSGVAERYAYKAYGQPSFLSANFALIGSSAYDWDMLFAGYRFDGATGLYIVRNRIEHATLGRWLSRDPVGAWLLFSNLYAYADSRPCAATDPEGLAPIFQNCPAAERSCLTQAWQLAINGLTDPEYLHCFQSMLNDIGAPCDSGELTNCLNTYLSNPTIHCGIGNFDAQNVSPCTTTKTNQQKTCKGANCAPCADTSILIHVVGSYPGTSAKTFYQKYCTDKMGKPITGGPGLLASMLVHEAAHSCVGEHSPGRTRYVGGVAVDRCCRPDPYFIEKRFAECHGFRYWRVPPNLRPPSVP